MNDAILGLQIKEEQRGAVRKTAKRRRFGRSQIIATSLLVLALVSAGLAVHRLNAPMKVDVIAMPVDESRAAGSGVITAGGYVRHARVINVVPRIAGTLSEVNVAEGDDVKEGDVIARIESNELEDSANEATAEVRVARAQLAQLRAGARPGEIAEARSKVDALRIVAARYQRDRERSKVLADTGSLSQQSLDQSDTDALATGKTLEAAEHALSVLLSGPRLEAVASAQAALDAARARMSRTASLLRHTSIRAPISGRILRKYLEVGSVVSFGLPYSEAANTVAAGSPIVTIGDLSAFEVTSDLLQTEVGRITPGQAVEIRSDALPGILLGGKVARIAPRADRSKNTIEVVVKLDPPIPKGLAHDLAVKLTFQSDVQMHTKTHPQIPLRVTFERANQRFVYVAEHGYARLRRINLGEVRGDGTAVVSGVNGGELIVASRLDILEDGSPVSPKYPSGAER